MNKPDPQQLKSTFALFLKHTDVNYVFTNLVLDDKDKAIALAKQINDSCNVDCRVIDEQFKFVTD